MSAVVHHAGIIGTGRTQRGIDFIRSHASIWLALGRVTPWPDEANPPELDMAQTAIDEVFGLKLFDRAAMVVPDSTGPIVNGDDRYREVTDQQALDLQTPYLAVTFILQPDEFPGISYRQIGVFVDSIPQQGLSSFRALLPAQFKSLGRLYYVDNSTPITRYPNTKHTHYMITVPEANASEA